MEHPAPETLKALAQGDLSDAERSELFAHTDECEDCRDRLASLARRVVPTTDAIDPTLDVVSRESGKHLRTAAIFPRGTRIGRYEVEYLLGTGGLGVVYAAHDPELGRRVALKLLKIDARDGGGGQERLAREARALARISHPNVVAVYDVGVFEDRVFVAMELIVGRDLRAWLAQGRRGWREVVDVFSAAGRGLVAAHAAGLIHRDFKPDNLLIGDDGRVCVTDFGLARAADTDAPALAGRAAEPPVDPTGPTFDPNADPLYSPLTQVGQVVGTPAYMAPEQHEGMPADTRTDQFSFCASLYEALYGIRPYAGAVYAELRDSVIKGRLRPPPRETKVPRTLAPIVLRGLALRPAARWPSMEALLAALGRDRTRLPRRIAGIAGALLAVLATALISDYVLRDRDAAVAKTSFAAAGRALDRALSFRSETFGALADLSTMVPIIREAAAARDQASFGLGNADADVKQLGALHASLRDADWDAWSATTRRGTVAVADYKGRLLYATGTPDAFGFDTRVVDAVARAYHRGGTGEGMEVVRADDQALVESGLAPAPPRTGLVVVIAHASVLAGVPQAALIQTMPGRAFLSDLGGEPGLALGLVTSDGALDGDVPGELAAVARDAGGAMVSVRHDGRSWLVQSHALPGLERAVFVMARTSDVGLSGLFPNARILLALASALAVGVLAAALSRWRKFGRVIVAAE